MNLKEAFHYQNFLNSLMNNVPMSIGRMGGALKITKKHLRSKVNPDASDTEEVIEPDNYIPLEVCAKFMNTLIEAKQALSEAISNAKAGLDFDMDAAVEANKFRQSANNALKRALNANKPYVRTEQGTDYKFNAEGNQTTYYYEVEVTAEEMFDKKNIKDTARRLITEANDVSAKIDMAMVNTTVDYVPVFDINESFEDIIAEFAESVKECVV